MGLIDRAGLALTLCDGCGGALMFDQIKIESAEGRQCRYCEECAKQYAAFHVACLMEEKRLNALLDLFIADVRQKVPLRLVPQDLPKVKDERGIVLG